MVMPKPAKYTCKQICETLLALVESQIVFNTLHHAFQNGYLRYKIMSQLSTIVIYISEILVRYVTRKSVKFDQAFYHLFCYYFHSPLVALPIRNRFCCCFKVLQLKTAGILTPRHHMFTTVRTKPYMV